MNKILNNAMNYCVFFLKDLADNLPVTLNDVQTESPWIIVIR